MKNITEAIEINETIETNMVNRGIKPNKGLRKLAAHRFNTAAFLTLENIKAECLMADPLCFHTSEERFNVVKNQTYAELDKYDTSPCPDNERVRDMEDVEVRDLRCYDLIHRFMVHCGVEKE